MQSCAAAAGAWNKKRHARLSSPASAVARRTRVRDSLTGADDYAKELLALATYAELRVCVH